MEQVLSGIILPVFIIAAGGYFTVRLRGFFILHPLRTLFGMLESDAGNGSKRKKENGESPFKSLMLALAGTLGVGNIIGVSTAIIGGGPGSILWMILGAFFSMSLKYAEILLAVYHRKPDPSGNGFYGGAACYIRDGLPERGMSCRSAAFLSGVFAVLCIVNSLTTGTVIQVNAISESFGRLFGIKPLLCAALVAVMTVMAVRFGSDGISSVTAVMIPLACVFYILLSFAVIAANRALILDAIGIIVSSAFSEKSAVFGISGYGISAAMRYGIVRGLISNEAGSGTAPSAHARANAATSAQQGFWGIFEVFADTVIMCSITALALVMHAMKIGKMPENGTAFVIEAYSAGGKSFAGYLLGVCIFIFAYATVLCQYFYGREGLRYLPGKDASGIKNRIFTVCFFAAIFAGAFLGTESVWRITDIAVSSMTVINITVLLVLRNTVAEQTDMFFGKRRTKKERTENKNRAPEKKQR